MQLKRINSAIDRVERNKINENFDILERGYGKAFQDSQLAKDQSNYAVETSDEAKVKADSVQLQIDQLVIEGDSSVEAAQARVSADATTYDTLKARLDAENAQITQQLAQTKQKITCSSIGMTESDDGYSNFEKLTSALKDNIIIIVDGLYKLATDVTFSFLSDIEITSDNPNNGFEFVTSAAPFFTTTTPNKKVHISNIKIIYNGSGIARILDFPSSVTKIDKIEVYNTKIEGSIRFMEYTAVNTINPTTTDYGINEFYFKFNKIKNVNASFINVGSCPFEMIDFSYNDVNNFNYRLLSCSIDNEHSYLTEIKNARKVVKFTHNNIKCDGDWWGTSGAVYFVAALVECREYFYENNHVEGMKTKDDVALYDTYASADFVHANNNVYKNNAIFNTQRNTILMKAKSGSGIKKFHNNGYIVEQSFVDLYKSFGEPIFKMYDIEYGVDPSVWEIKNNKIDVPKLRFEESSRAISNFDFVDNIITAKSISNTMVMSNLPGAIVRLEGNLIINDATSSNFFTLVGAPNITVNNYKSISLKNNNIRANVRSLLQQVRADDVVVMGNKISSEGASNTLNLINYGKVKDLLIKDNHTSDNYRSGLINRCDVTGNLFVSLTQSTKILEGSRMLFWFDYLKDYLNELRTKEHYLIKVSTTTKDGYFEGSSKVAVYSESGINYVEFTDSESTLVSYPIEAIGSETTQGDGTLLKIEGNLPFGLVFKNNANDRGFITTSNVYGTKASIQLNITKIFE